MKPKVYMDHHLYAGRVHGRMNMWTDPIVEEVRRVREEHAAKFDCDISRIVADVKKREQESKRVIVAPPRRTHRGANWVHTNIWS